MRDQLYTYSLIRTLYDQGEDYIDSFWPLVLRSLPNDGTPAPLDAPQQRIREKYGLDIPKYSLDHPTAVSVDGHGDLPRLVGPETAETPGGWIDGEGFTLVRLPDQPAATVTVRTTT